MQKNLAEFIGTFWLVFGGVGSAMIAGAFPELGIGFAGVSLPYIISQVLGAIAAAGILYLIMTSNGSPIQEFGANGYDEHSPR